MVVHRNKRRTSVWKDGSWRVRHTSISRQTPCTLYTCNYTCIYIYTYESIRVHSNRSKNMCSLEIYKYIHMNIHMYVCVYNICVDIYKCLYMFICIYTCVYIYVYMTLWKHVPNSCLSSPQKSERDKACVCVCVCVCLFRCVFKIVVFLRCFCASAHVPVIYM